MKVYLKMSGVRGTGKGFFFERLASAMRNKGIEIVDRFVEKDWIALIGGKIEQ